MNFLSLDPSVNNVGFCLFRSGKRNIKDQWKWGVWELGGSNYQARLVDLVDYIQELLDEYKVKELHYLVTEWPTFFSSEAGQIAAHQSYTIDLAGICGYVAGRLGMDHRQWHIITATSWKGSVPKFVTVNKFLRIFGKRYVGTSEHAVDAIMIMHFFLLNYGESLFQAAGLDSPELPQ